RRQYALRSDLVLRIRHDRDDRLALLARRTSSDAIDAATRREHEILYAGSRCRLGDRHRAALIDVERHRLELIAHRIVRDGRQLDDRIIAAQIEADIADVAVELFVEVTLR